MSNDVLWIKLLTSLPDDEKIKLIEGLPERDAIFYTWIRLLIQAGKCNADGYIYLAPDIPYSEEMLSTVFNRPLTTIRLALDTFVKLHMIEISEGGHIFIPRFSEIQNTEALNRIRENGRLRQIRFRDRVKQLKEGVDESVTRDSRESNATEKSRVEKKENRVDKSNTKLIYGEFKNVLLTTEEYNKLFNQLGFEDTQKLIEKLSSGIEAKGYKYKSHYAALLNWHRRDQTEKGKRPQDNTNPDKYTEGPYGHMVQS